MANRKTLEDKLNFINDAKKTNIAKVHVKSVKMGRVNVHPIIIKDLKKQVIKLKMLSKKC